MILQAVYNIIYTMETMSNLRMAKLKIKKIVQFAGKRVKPGKNLPTETTFPPTITGEM